MFAIISQLSRIFTNKKETKKKKRKKKERGNFIVFVLSFHRTALGEACNGDTVFADSLEAFGGGTDDPVSVSVGGRFLYLFKVGNNISLLSIFGLKDDNYIC